MIPLLCSLLLAAPPHYDDKADLLYYLDEAGKKQTVRTARDWQVRVGHVKANMELVMGELPAKSSEALAVEIKSETELLNYRRKHISYVAEKGDRVTAYLLVPHAAFGKKLPALVCLPESGRPGKDQPSGLTPKAALAHAHELADRGYVCIVPDYPLLHANEYKTDPYKLGYVSATMKGIVNHRRAVDVLETLDNVDRDAIGVIGHSLGGHNSLFLAVFEPRIKVIVSSCGFNVFAKHAGGDVRAWSSKYYMPRIKDVYKDDPKKIPFDFTEVLGALAPRPVYVNAPLYDLPDFEVSGVRDCVVAATPIYKLHDASDRLVVEYPDAGHTFPLAQRLAAYHFLDRHLKKAANGPGVTEGLLAHWPLHGDGIEKIGKRKPLKERGIDWKAGGRDGKAGSAAGLEGDASLLEVPSLGLADKDFSLSLWMHTERLEDVGDLLSQFDAKKGRGVHVSLKTSNVTTSQANTRQLHFGVADEQAEPARVLDCGRPGNAILAFAMAVHEGFLYAGTCEPGEKEAGRVYRFAGPDRWVDCGAPDKCNTVSALATYQGKLYAGVSRYRLRGSALAESKNQTAGGKIYRYEGESRWVECGELPGADSVGCLVVYRGKLYASSIYAPASFYRYEGEKKWTDAGTPGGKRVVALAVFGEHLYAGSYDGGHVYRCDGKEWADLGRLGASTQTYAFVVYEGRLHVGTWPEGKVYRLDGEKWTDMGRLGEEKEVMGMAVHNGGLFAGTLPSAQVYRLEKPGEWKAFLSKPLDETPQVTYRRAWTMAEFQGRLFVSTLPSGKVFALRHGGNVTWDQELSPGWHHVVAVKEGELVKLYVDGRLAAATVNPLKDATIKNDAPLRLGSGANERFRGRISELRVYGRALTPREIAELAQR